MIFRIKELSNGKLLAEYEYKSPEITKLRLDQITNVGNQYRMYAKKTREEKWKRLSDAQIRRMLKPRAGYNRAVTFRDGEDSQSSASGEEEVILGGDQRTST